MYVKLVPNQKADILDEHLVTCSIKAHACVTLHRRRRLYFNPARPQRPALSPQGGWDSGRERRVRGHTAQAAERGGQLSPLRSCRCPCSPAHASPQRMGYSAAVQRLRKDDYGLSRQDEDLQGIGQTLALRPRCDQ